MFRSALFVNNYQNAKDGSTSESNTATEKAYSKPSFKCKEEASNYQMFLHELVRELITTLDRVVGSKMQSFLADFLDT